MASEIIHEATQRLLGRIDRSLARHGWGKPTEGWSVYAVVDRETGELSTVVARQDGPTRTYAVKGLGPTDFWPMFRTAGDSRWGMLHGWAAEKGLELVKVDAMAFFESVERDCFNERH